ncbi:hypothetical protein EVAR_39172_1 [Eumeta japonica]|uniref:Uncharacterized protein n=1 Tax=Eumeta variegata TaxID=151549 RepID=A0A4C1VPZ5_EUMVA|nr:hypothetical protein EVAR_39172_1 [Eumeta japonica]
MLQIVRSPIYKNESDTISEYLKLLKDDSKNIFTTSHVPYRNGSGGPALSSLDAASGFDKFNLFGTCHKPRVYNPPLAHHPDYVMSAVSQHNVV